MQRNELALALGLFIHVDLPPRPGPTGVLNRPDVDEPVQIGRERIGFGLREDFGDAEVAVIGVELYLFPGEHIRSVCADLPLRCHWRGRTSSFVKRTRGNR